MEIADVMTQDAKVVEPDAHLRHAAMMMDEINVGALPVCNGRQLVGMITDRDMAVRGLAAGLGPETPVSEVMTAEVDWCYDSDSAADVLERMSGRQIRRIPVVDGEKNLVGVVALGDLSTERVPGAGETLRRISEPSEPDR